MPFVNGVWVVVHDTVILGWLFTKTMLSKCFLRREKLSSPVSYAL